MTTQARAYGETSIATKALLIVIAVGAGVLAAYLGLRFEPKIVIGLLLGLLFGTGIVLRPQIGVLFLVVTMPVINIFPPTFFGSGVANPTNLVLGWIAFSIALHRIFVLRIGLARRAFVPPVIAYAGVLVYSIALTLLGDGGGLPEFADMTRTYLNGAFLYFLAANVIEDVKHAKWIFWAVLATVAATAAWGFVEYRSDIAAGMMADRVRVSGRVGQPNSFGAYLAMYLPFLIGAARLKGIPRIIRVAAICAVGGAFFVLLLTQSRGAYLGVLGALIFLGVVANRKLLLIIVAAALVYPLWLPTQVVDRVMITFEGRHGGEYDGSTNTRIDFYKAGVEMWKRSPVWGHGFKAYNRLVFQMGVADSERAAHSLIIQMLAETGIIGVGTLFVMLGFFFRRAWRFFRSSENDFMKRFGESYCACVIALVLVNAFGVRFYNFLEIGYFWILSALLVRFTDSMAGRAHASVRRAEEAV